MKFLLGRCILRMIIEVLHPQCELSITASVMDINDSKMNVVNEFA